MRALAFFTAVFFYSLSAVSQHVLFSSTDEPGVYSEVLKADDASIVLKVSTTGYSFREVNVNGKMSRVIYGANTTQLLEKGYPDLPKHVVSVALPQGAEPVVEVIKEEYAETGDCEIAPSKGMLLASEAAEDIPYIYNSSYASGEYWPVDRVYLRNTYFLGPVRGQTVVVQPFSYNGVKKTLRFYTSLIIRISFHGSDGNRLGGKKYSAEFNEIIQNHFINAPGSYDPVDENGELLVICPQQWKLLMEPFAAWKVMKGIPVTVVDLGETGNTAAAIKQYIDNFYLTHNLTHVLLAGDDSIIPSMTAAGAVGPSDPSFGFINGNDAYPEVFVGRFPAQTAAELSTMTERVIHYERYPDTTSTWYSNAAGIASNFGPGDDNEMDWEHLSNIRSQLLNFSYSNVTELYDGSHPSTTDQPGDPAASELSSLFNSGLSLINYTGHGTTTAFSTTGFSNFDISQLTNHNMLPFIWSAGCTNGNFTSVIPCMGEAFLRATNNGLSTGAIATLMSSINQYWSPPMDAQDEMNAILTESIAGNSKRTFGGISFNGCMKMNDNYGAAGELMTATWHCFGDPTLNVRTAQPVPLLVMHPANMQLGDTQLVVTCNATGALAALTQKGRIVGTARVVNDTAKMEFEPLLLLDSLSLVVTGFNYYPYEGKIAVLTPPGPYIIAAGTVNHELSGNGNNIPDYGETIVSDLYIYNAGGSASAGNLSVYVQSNDSVVSLINGSSYSISLNSGDTLMIDSAFIYSIGSPYDQHAALFNVMIADSVHTFHSSFLQMISAPVLTVDEVTIQDTSGNANGILEPGESAVLVITFTNKGHAAAYSLTTAIVTDSLLTAFADTVLAPQLAADSSLYISFPVTLSSSVQPGGMYSFTAKIRSGMYSAERTFTRAAGYRTETFESGDLDQFEWITSGSEPWFVTSALPYSGLYCTQSGDIDNSESSTLRIELQCLLEDSLTFMYKLSCEATWDGLSLSVDSVLLKGWSGIIPWTKDGILLTPGLHTIDFTYSKDNILSAGQDCAWLDEIRFPPFSTVVAVNEIVTDRELTCYPVPAHDALYINAGMSDFSVSIIDMAGTTVKNEAKARSDGRCIMNVSDLTEGIYLVVARNEKQMFRKRISIVHPK